MPECIQCGAFTKYEKGLCYNCYQNKQQPAATWGMSDKDHNYRFNMIKGRIAETLIQELFLSLGYNVFRYGMENTIPGIMDLLRGGTLGSGQGNTQHARFCGTKPQQQRSVFCRSKV